jgi:hypothetical protein
MYLAVSKQWGIAISNNLPSTGSRKAIHPIRISVIGFAVYTCCGACMYVLIWKEYGRPWEHQISRYFMITWPSTLPERPWTLHLFSLQVETFTLSKYKIIWNLNLCFLSCLKLGAFGNLIISREWENVELLQPTEEGFSCKLLLQELGISITAKPLIFKVLNETGDQTFYRILLLIQVKSGKLLQPNQFI